MSKEVHTMGTDEIPESGGSSIELWLSGGEERVAQVELWAELHGL